MNLPSLHFAQVNGHEEVMLKAIQDVLEFQRQYTIVKFKDRWALLITGKDADDITYHDSIEDAKEYANTVNIVYMQNLYDRVINKPYLERYKMIEPAERHNYTCAICGTNKSVKYLVRTIKKVSHNSMIVTEIPMCHGCFFIFNNSIYGVHGSCANIATRKDIKKLISSSIDEQEQELDTSILALQDFMQQCCIENEDKDAFLPARDLYDAYRKYSLDKGEQPLLFKDFNKMLELVYNIRRIRRHSSKNSNKTGFYGIKINDIISNGDTKI